MADIPWGIGAQDNEQYLVNQYITWLPYGTAHIGLWFRGTFFTQSLAAQMRSAYPELRLGKVVGPSLQVPIGPHQSGSGSYMEVNSRVHVLVSALYAKTEACMKRI